MNRPYSLASARILRSGRDNWQPKTQTPWQRERASGPIIPLQPVRIPLHSRIKAWVKQAYEQITQGE